MREHGSAMGGYPAALMVALVLLALVLSGIAFLGTRPTYRTADIRDLEEAVTPLRNGDVQVRAEIEAMRARLGDLEAEVQALSATTGRGSADDAERRVREMDERLEKLKRNVDSIAKKAEVTSSEARLRESLRSRRGNLDRILKAYQMQAIDWSLGARERVKALEMLRHYGGRSPDVVRAILKLLRESADPEIRADILGNLEGLQYPEMAKVLLEILGSDPDEKVRIAAASTLSGFSKDESVWWALDEATRNDPSASVREQAKASLASAEPAKD